MNQEFKGNEIYMKLSGKYSNLYPIYGKLKEELFNIGKDIKIILKTIYMRVDFDNGLYGIIQWNEDGLEFLLPIKIEHERLLSTKHQGWKELNKMVRFKRPEDVDGFIVNLLKEINNK